MFRFSLGSLDDPEPDVILEDWDGYVAAIHDSAFVAHLTRRGDTRNVLQASIPLTEDMRKYIQEGTFVRWTVGYNDKKDVSSGNGPYIYLRINTDTITADDMVRARAWADKIRVSFMAPVRSATKGTSDEQEKEK